MLDWIILLLPCVIGIISALICLLRNCTESIRQKKLSEEISVAHYFPNNSDECETGQLFVKDNDVFLKKDDSYVKLATDNNHSHLPTNCVNCGAPLHGHICKFCDTEYN